MRLITAEQMLQRSTSTHILMLAQAGFGKTFQARTLPDQQDTVFVAMEAGTRTLEGEIVDEQTGRLYPAFGGSFIENPRTWDEVRSICCLIGGIDPSAPDGKPYSASYYRDAVAQYPDEARAIDAARNIFMDSISEMSAICWKWVEQQPQSWTAKGGFDNFGAYRLIGTELCTAFKHVQRRRDKNIIFAGILQQATGGGHWEPQVHGNVAPREIPGIFDVIVSGVLVVSTQSGVFLAEGQPQELPRHRILVCRQLNPWGLPAKDRTSRLAMLETPDLGQLLAKMNNPRL